MSGSDALPEPDRLDAAPHPRDTARLLGQSGAEASFLAAYGTGRLHHAWLLCGPRGCGKATLAWSIARFLISRSGPEPLAATGALGTDPDHPVARRMRAGAEPRLFLLRRGPTDRGDRLADRIRVEDVRKLAGFFALSAADGGDRVVIVDAADELNGQAANALLKMLEEPPARTTLLLVSHQPAALLPTIRSRCRTLRLSPLGAQDLSSALEQAGMPIAEADAPALTTLAAGSVGAAIRLQAQGGLALYAELVALLDSLPALDRPRLLALAESCAGRGKEQRLDLLLELTDRITARIARSGALQQEPDLQAAPGEARLITRLAPDQAAARRWAEAGQRTAERARHARAVNVEPGALVTDLFLGLSRSV